MAAKTGAWLSLVERLVRDQEVAGSNPVAPTTLDSAYFRPSFSKGRRTPRTDAAGGFPYCSPFATTTFSRRPDRGRRYFRARRDERGRRELSGWGTRICGTDRRKRCAGVPAGSGGRRVRQGRRAERQGRLSGPTVPKGGASLRASLAAVGSGQAAPLPALGVRSSHAGGSGAVLAASYRPASCISCATVHLSPFANLQSISTVRFCVPRSTRPT